jgi:uncharacterized cupin superfamily protein
MMPTISRALVEVASTTSKMTPSPIERSWVIEGNPVAELSLLSRSADGQAWTVVWQCSAGKFHWHYDFDETILILEGEIVIESDGMPPTRYGSGDVIFFKEGAHAKWQVEGHVRKLAFCRKTQPALINFAVRGLSKIKRTLMPGRHRKVASLAG